MRLIDRIARSLGYVPKNELVKAENDARRAWARVDELRVPWEKSLSDRRQIVWLKQKLDELASIPPFPVQHLDFQSGVVHVDFGRDSRRHMRLTQKELVMTFLPRDYAYVRARPEEVAKAWAKDVAEKFRVEFEKELRALTA